MAKRLGRNVTDVGTARVHGYNAHIVGSADADYSGNCCSPVLIPKTGVPSVIGWLNGKEEKVHNVDIRVRCRKCPDCLKARAHHWRMRALNEIANSNRTWFGTLTLRPEEQFRAMAKARQTLKRGGTNWEHLTSAEHFTETCREIVPDLQRYLKRIRKHAAGVRFLAVFEPHKSGQPHIHMLVHETKDSVRHRRLAAWPLGFTKFNLVAQNDTRAAHYVSKYLVKSLYRPIASLHYGHTNETPVSATVSAAEQSEAECPAGK